jgi:cation diffusion facilitator CzcD-associated flavoprotein CzcO/acetyl esterase/lipase
MDERPTSEYDVVVVGAGFSGLYMIHKLRELGFTVHCYDVASDVGGTWYWNRYPGARCDIPTTDYAYSFDPELEEEWTWSEKYATQPEILAYLARVADKHHLRRDITFGVGVDAARWDDGLSRWRLTMSSGDEVLCRFYVMASGCLSMPKEPDIAGTERFGGDVYVTGRWPHEGVDFTGQKVAVIGTGSSGIQSIPLIAEQASRVTIFQRTPNFSIPAHNGPASPERLAELAADREGYRERARRSRGGVPSELTDISGVTASEEVRRERFESAWAAGELFAILGVFADEMFNPEANEIVAEMIREKIRETVKDKDVAAALCPYGYPFGTKRPCLDTGYFETFNRDSVELVDLTTNPITSITETGVQTSERHYDVDAIVYATGFDAMTGAIVAVDITGTNSLTLREKWADGPSTYLGLMTAGFPNLFTITGPGSPSVLSNMVVSIEQHVEFIAECLTYLRAQGFERIEPTEVAEAGWDQHVADCASITLYPKAASWYMGANVPGKPRVFLPYIGGVDGYRATCEELVGRGWMGFSMSGPGGAQCHDGVIRRMQPDVALMLQMMESAGVPELHTLSPADARSVMDMMGQMSPPGPTVGEMVDGTLPGPGGPLEYRLYRPVTPGPHPVVVYFHGGGWVIGNTTSDEAMCRDLCVRADSIIISIGYRHAPEDRFPAAHEDAYAATCWVADHAEELGAVPGELAVAGWSAGANLAAATCQRARDEDGPTISGQLLLCAVTDASVRHPSYEENGEGYILTAALMDWFLDHYVDAADREDPRVSPLRGQLEDLPPACVIVADFDPLRDEGVAYANALEAAGNDVELLNARGHVHTSVRMVDVIVTGAQIREQMAAAIRGFFKVSYPVGR